MNKLSLLLMACFALAFDAIGQVTITIDPNANNAIKGHLELDRQKYFVLSVPSGNFFDSRIPEQSIRSLMLDQYDVQLGRALGMVSTATQYSNSVFEDPSKPGFMDVERYKSMVDLDLGGSQDYVSRWDNLDIAVHEHHSGYPSFMPKWTAPQSDRDNFPPTHLPLPRWSLPF